MSNIAQAAKAHLVGKINVLEVLLPGVTVSYSAPVQNVPRDLVYGGSITGPVQLNAMAAAGRVKRREDLVLLLHVRVYRPGQNTTETAEARAAEIGEVIATYIAGNWTFGGLDGLKKAEVTSVDLSEGWTDDDGAGSTLTISVGLLITKN